MFGCAILSIRRDGHGIDARGNRWMPGPVAGLLPAGVVNAVVPMAGEREVAFQAGLRISIGAAFPRPLAGSSGRGSSCATGAVAPAGSPRRPRFTTQFFIACLRGWSDDVGRCLPASQRCAGTRQGLIGDGAALAAFEDLLGVSAHGKRADNQAKDEETDGAAHRGVLVRSGVNYLVASRAARHQELEQL